MTEGDALFHKKNLVSETKRVHYTAFTMVNGKLGNLKRTLHTWEVVILCVLDLNFLTRE